MSALPRTGLATLCFAAAAAGAAPITFNTALPVHEGGYVLREQALFMKIADDPSPARRDMEVTGLVSILGYGLTRDFALFGVLPYLDKRLDVDAGGRRITLRKSGIGDAMLLGRYTAYQSDVRGRTFRIAPFAGVKAPTGKDDARGAFGRLPPMVQSGSGSWDALAGAVLTYQTLDFQIDAQGSYTARRQANGFEAGDTAAADVSLQYRLWPRTVSSGVPAFVYGVLETNLVHSSRDRVGGVDDPNTGGTSLFVSPGIQYVTRKWIAEAGVQIPVAQRLHGSALKSDYAMSAGVRVNF